MNQAKIIEKAVKIGVFLLPVVKEIVRTYLIARQEQIQKNINDNYNNNNNTLTPNRSN